MFKYTATIRYYDTDLTEKVESIGELNGYDTFRGTKGIFTGFSEVIARITGELNSAYIETISNDSREFPIFSLITINVYDQSEESEPRTLHYYVSRDKVEISDKANGLYLHTIELIDLTKKLEKKVLETICFTQPTKLNELGYSIWDCLQRIFHIYKTNEITLTRQQVDNFYNGSLEIEFIQNKNNGDIIDFIDYDLKDKLKSIQAPELVLSNLTLREAFDTIFKYVNAITKVEYLDDENAFMLSCEFFNETKNLINYITKNETNNTQVSCEDFCSNLENFVENQINEGSKDTSVVVYPNDVSYIGLKTRANNFELTDENFGILLEHNIYALQKVYTRVRLYGTAVINGEILTISPFYYDLDISSHIVDKEQFESLEYSDYLNPLNLSRRSVGVYEYNDNFIDLSGNYRGTLFTYHNFTSVVSASIVQGTIERFKQEYRTQLENYDVEIDLDVDYRFDTTATLATAFGRANYTIDHITKEPKNCEYDTVDDPIEDFFDDIKFRVSYIPIKDSRLATHKTNTEIVNLDTTNLSNQKAKIVSLQNLSINEKSTIERIGNENIEIAIRHKSLNQLYHTGDYTSNGYIITKCEYIYYDDFILGKYELTKNYTKLSEYIGINSEYRPYEIPNNNRVYERKMLVNDFVYFSDLSTQIEQVIEPTTLQNDITSTFVINLLSGINNNHCLSNFLFFFDVDKYEQMYSDFVSGANAIVMSCTRDYAGDNLIFHTQFKDNISCDYIYTTKEVNGEEKKLMQKVPYTTNGKLCQISFTLLTGQTNFLNSKLPLINENQIDLDPEILHNINVLKDAKEYLDLTYEISFINKNPENIKLHKDFYKYNPLLATSSISVYFYTYTEEFDKNLDYIPNSAVNQGVLLNRADIIHNGVGITGFKMKEEALPIPERYKSFFLGDKDKGIVLLSGKISSIVDGIKFTFSTQRTDIRERY